MAGFAFTLSVLRQSRKKGCAGARSFIFRYRYRSRGCRVCLLWRGFPHPAFGRPLPAGEAFFQGRVVGLFVVGGCKTGGAGLATGGSGGDLLWRDGFGQDDDRFLFSVFHGVPPWFGLPASLFAVMIMQFKQIGCLLIANQQSKDFAGFQGWEGVRRAEFSGFAVTVLLPG